MANDNLRSGPEGATAQASRLGPRIVKLSVSDDATAATAVLEGKAAAALGNNELTKATANSFAWAFPTCEPMLMGGEWVIESLMVVFTQDTATNNVTFDVGIYAQNPAGGALKVVDANAIVAANVITHGAASVAGTVVNVPLNGVAAGLQYYNTGAGNKVTTTIGEGVGTFADDNTAITGHNQFLYLTNTTSAGNGKYVVYAVCKPVGGVKFKK